jgi:hypothetical protein
VVGKRERERERLDEGTNIGINNNHIRPLTTSFDNRDQLRYHLLVALIIMLILLMMQLEKLGFIAFDKNLMFLILLRNGKF